MSPARMVGAFASSAALILVIALLLGRQEAHEGVAVVTWFLLPIVLASYLGNRMTGLVVTGVSVLAAIFVCASGPGSLSGLDMQRIEIFAVVGVTMALTFDALHRARARAQRSYEDAVRDKARLAMMFEQSPVAKCLSRLGERTVVDVNPAYLRTFGVRREDIVGFTPTEAGITVAQREQLLMMVAEDGQLREVEAEFRLKDGQTRSVLISSQMVEVDGESLLLSTFIDMTDNHAAKAAARAASDRLQDIANLIDSSFWTVDLVANKMLYVSPGYERIWGRPHAEHMDRPFEWLDGVHPLDRERMRKRVLRDDIAHGDIDEFRVLRPDGTIRWVSARVYPIRDEHGRLARLSGVSDDITQRKEAELLANRLEARFQQLAEAIDDVFWLSDIATSEVIYISPAYERIWGRRITTLEDTRRDWLESIHPDDKERVRIAFSGRAADGYRARYRIQRPCGEIRWIQERAFPVMDESGTVIRLAGVAKDITEELALQANVEQAQKMESIGLLAGGVAHDFNNILCVITSTMDLLHEALPPCSPDHELIDEIQTATQRASSLTRQLLAFGRKEVVKPVDLDLNAAVEEGRRMLRRILGEDTTLTVSLDPDLERVRVDPGQITQLLMNLCVNARDAMGVGGTISIETRSARGEAWLVVRDNGPGMSDEVKARAFEPFFTTKPVGKGTGLGLSVVHGIVQQAGGSIHLESMLGAGTIFRIVLPTVPPTVVATSSSVSKAECSGRILLVDDDHQVRATASRTLRKRGYEVIEAVDGSDAIRLLRARSGQVDLLITDVVMPIMSGRELAEIAAAEHPGLRILFTSGYTDDEVMRRGILQSEVVFLQKPFGGQALANKVREMLVPCS